MKVLFVFRETSGEISPFVKEQSESLIDQGIHIEYFGLKFGGIRGYLFSYYKLKKILANNKYDIVHGHYGLSGFIISLQKNVNKIITFHGCDVNNNKIRAISKLAEYFSTFSIFVNKDMQKKINPSNPSAIIPCGVNPITFYPIEQKIAKEKLGLSKFKKYVLFASRFDYIVKNSKLAFQTLQYFPNLELIELKNRKREEVNLLLNACEFLFLTSIREGSPQIIKEAALCNCPIVASNVGDIKENFNNIEGIYLTSFEVDNIIANIKKALNFRETKRFTTSRDRIFEYGLDIESISKKIISIYKKTMSK